MFCTLIVGCCAAAEWLSRSSVSELVSRRAAGAAEPLTTAGTASMRCLTFRGAEAICWLRGRTGSAAVQLDDRRVSAGGKDDEVLLVVDVIALVERVTADNQLKRRTAGCTCWGPSWEPY